MIICPSFGLNRISICFRYHLLISRSRFNSNSSARDVQTPAFTINLQADIIFSMINYILLYKIRKAVKHILKEKIEDGEIATTPRSCLGCLADELSWEIYYLIKEREDKKKGGPAESEVEDKSEEDNKRQEGGQ